jgi:apolipoprotein D and lipocalin family protein
VDHAVALAHGGQWHEIAHLPMFFQRKCAANITATYTPRADGLVGVRNACDDKDGGRMVSEGLARPVAGHPGRLEVRFAPDWLAWAPMVWADCWVLELDPEYRWAVVGGPGRKGARPTVPSSRFRAFGLRATAY